MLIFPSIKIKRTGLFIASAFLLGLAFLSIKEVSAATASTSILRGKAWWGDTLRYVYFNCLDDEIGDRLDVPENLSGSGKYLPPDDKFHFFLTPCTDIVHGAYINSEGNFYGSAWNLAKGLIYFDRDEASSNPPPPAYSFNSHCVGSCTPANNCLACYVESEQKAYGWAYVKKDDTWIKLDSTGTPPVLIQNWDLDNSVFPGYGVEPGDFVGTASSDNGDLSFNCVSEPVGTFDSSHASACDIRDYKVKIGNLQLGHLSAPNWDFTQACNNSALRANLRWYKKSGTQSAYEVVVNTSPSFNIGSHNYVCYSGKVNSDANNYAIPNSDPTCHLDYNTSYYWWIKLYDEIGAATQWYKFGEDDGHHGSLDTHTNASVFPDANIYSFLTYKHEFPRPLFTWSPLNIVVGTTTLFTSRSQFYTNSTQSVPQNCFGANCSYWWSSTDPLSVILSPDQSTTSIFFYRAGNINASLRVTDSEGYACSTSTDGTLEANYALPLWHEIKAE